MTTQKIAIGLVAVALFVGSMTAHAADFDAGVKAYDRGDYETALRIFRQLADQGNARAQTYLGFMYDNGLGVTQNYEAALRWFRKAAEQGDTTAQYIVGVMYEDGMGVPQHYVAAVMWYRKAAEQGNDIAQANLGIMYDLGQGVTQDYVLAHMWYNIAASQGKKDTGELRDHLANTLMTPAQIAEAQKLAREWKPKGK